MAEFAENENVEEMTISTPEVVTKYQDAARIANNVLGEVMNCCRSGAKVIDLCKMGDDLILQVTK